MKSDKEINELFVKEYLKDLCPGRAALRCGAVEDDGIPFEIGTRLVSINTVAIENAVREKWGDTDELVNRHREARMNGDISASNEALNMIGKQSALDKQVDGDHYKTPIQPIEYIHANSIGFCEGNVIKYVSRWRKKNGLADLEKAKHYIELLIQLEKGDNK